MLENAELEPPEGEEILVQALPDKVKEHFVTAADQLRAEGELRGMCRVLLRLLRKGFGAVNAELEQRVARAGEAELEIWTDRVTGASSLGEVFATSDAE